MLGVLSLLGCAARAAASEALLQMCAPASAQGLRCSASASPRAHHDSNLLGTQQCLSPCAAGAA